LKIVENMGHGDQIMDNPVLNGTSGHTRLYASTETGFDLLAHRYPHPI